MRNAIWCRRCAASATATALRAGLADGTIDAICSDHAPVDDDSKQLPFAEAEPGATGLELLLPLTLKWAHEAKIPLAAALARITTEPARVLGIDAGHLAPGAAADVCIFAIDEAWTRHARGAARARARTRRSWASSSPAGCAIRWSTGRSCTNRMPPPR